MAFCFNWIVIFMTLQSYVAFGETNYNSHKTAGISHIPWNMLLDPNYTSHNTSPKSNRTSFSPSQLEEYSPSVSFPYQQSSFNLVKDTGVYYVPPPAPHSLHQKHAVKYSPPFSANDHKMDGHFSASTTLHRPSEKVLFPAASSFHASKPLTSDLPHYVLHQQQPKNKKTTQVPMENVSKKQKRRKPDDYFDTDDEEEDYLDSYYQDYDYFEKERVRYKPSKQAHFIKNKDIGDPMGFLPSASDPEGFLSKAKDLLKGESYNKPSYSTGENYYSNYSPNKHYEDTAPYGGHSYYNQENMGYPSKDDHFGAPVYDFDAAYGNENHGGIIPYPDKRKGSKYGPLAFALGLLPLGLLLASLVPTVVTIPVTTAVATGRRRKRSVRFVNPVLETISQYGIAALEDPTCLNRIFCQVVREGNQERSSIVQKIYFKIANILDEKIAAYVGLKHLLLAVRKDECHHFQCLAQNKSSESNQKHFFQALENT